MKKILAILILAIFLSACQSTPQEFKGQQCQPVFAFDSRGDIDPGQSFCRCRDYLISKDFIGSRGNVIRRKLRECDQVLGYSVRENTRLVNFLQYVRSEINEANEIQFSEEDIAREPETAAISGRDLR